MSPTPRPPNVYLAAWSLYPLLVPFFLLGKESTPGGHKLAGGVPQPADYYLAGFMALVFLGLRCRPLRGAAPVVVALVAFVGYAALVNFSWAALLNDASLLKGGLFYAYDLLLFLTFLALYSRFGDRLLRVTVWAVAASVFLQVILLPFAPAPFGERLSGFFNDENQLGYFCVLSASLFALGAARFPVPPAVRLAFYGAVGYLTFVSQCRAAFLGLAALALIANLGRPLRLLLAAGVVAAAFLALQLAPDLLDKAHARLASSGEYDSLATRGYDRIVKQPEYVLLGAGEGAYGRFRSDLYGTELHSSFGTLLFCYGLVGVVCFGGALLLLGRRDLWAALYLVPAFVHGSAHQGLRFAFFWAVLAFVCCAAFRPRPADPPAEEAGKAPAARPRELAPLAAGVE
jgi:hypothetical protein